MWLVYLAALLSAAAPLHAQYCDPGMSWSVCASACDPTCENPDPVCVDLCVGKCVCPPERPIRHGDQCIAEASCGSTGCPPGKVLIACGPAPGCSKTCENPEPSCIPTCYSDCHCPDDEPYEHMGMCYKREDCPTGGGQAGECSLPGMVHSQRAPECARTCQAPEPCRLGLHPGCHCPDHAPILDGGRCIREDECGPPPSVCHSGMVYKSCASPPGCNHHCDGGIDDDCDGYTCQPGCQCPDGRPYLNSREECTDFAGCYLGTSAATHLTWSIGLILPLLLQYF